MFDRFRLDHFIIKHINRNFKIENFQSGGSWLAELAFVVLCTPVNYLHQWLDEELVQSNQKVTSQTLTWLLL
jgi:DNA polymerase III delta subunit